MITYERMYFLSKYILFYRLHTNTYEYRLNTYEYICSEQATTKYIQLAQSWARKQTKTLVSTHFLHALQAVQPKKPQHYLLVGGMSFGHHRPQALYLFVFGLVRVDPVCSWHTTPQDVLGKVLQVVKLWHNFVATAGIVKHVLSRIAPPIHEVLLSEHILLG